MRDDPVRRRISVRDGDCDTVTALHGPPSPSISSNDPEVLCASEHNVGTSWIKGTPVHLGDRKPEVVAPPFHSLDLGYRVRRSRVTRAPYASIIADDQTCA